MAFTKKMFTAVMDITLIKSKFRGCLLGSLLGDCLGAPYEGQDITEGDKITIQRYFDKLEDPSYRGIDRKYTDDTAMMKSVAKFLIEKSEPDFAYLAKLFVEEYFRQRNRGYGSNVIDIFEKLKHSNYEDVYTPASEQFDGKGSYGNGGAMRIAPIAIYFYRNYEKMIEVATNATKLTHTNVYGINGALLQCIAIHQALLIDPNNKIDSNEFCTQLSKKIKDIENTAEGEAATAYQNKIKNIQMLLGQKHHDDLDDEVIYLLGNGIGAYESVPTAIYCFLRAQREDIPSIETKNLYRKTIQYAISLGGDTDTIACMAGAIAGAYMGEESIDKSLSRHCEYNEEVIKLADSLFEKATATQV